MPRRKLGQVNPDADPAAEGSQEPIRPGNKTCCIVGGVLLVVGLAVAVGVIISSQVLRCVGNLALSSTIQNRFVPEFLERIRDHA